MLSILLLIGLPLLVHCGSSSTGSIIEPTKVPEFTASGTAGAKDLVTLAFSGTSPGSLIQLDVKLGGPSTATDIHAFSFNIVLSDPSLVRTITVVEGDALAGDQAVIATLTGDKVVIGVSKLGVTGNGIGAGGARILGLVFKMDPTKPGTTNLTFSDQKVQDPTGAYIATVNFDSASAKLTQPQ